MFTYSLGQCKTQRMEISIKEKVVKMLNACEDRMYEVMVKFGAYLSSRYGISPSTAISVTVGCIFLFMFVKRWWEQKRKRKDKPILQRSKSFALLYGGDLALRRLDEDQVAHALPYTLERSDLVLKGLLEEEHLDLKKLQIVTARLEMAGREEEGVKILEEAKVKNMEKSHHLYEINMLLAELLIYMGQLKKAQECKCLKDQKIIELDARRPLFKAIIYGMQNNWVKAERNWKKFIQLRESIFYGVGLGEPLPDISDFSAFKDKVQHLQNQIEEKKRIWRDVKIS